MTDPHSIDTFGPHLASALAETLELHSEHLRGQKIYGATLVPAPGTLTPRFGVLDDSDTVGAEPRRRWMPGEFCLPLVAPRLAAACSLNRSLHERWSGTSEEWRRASLGALSHALGSRPVRRAFHGLGADPILYIFDEARSGIEPTTFGPLNAGRESEPFYRQASRFLL